MNEFSDVHTGLAIDVRVSVCVGVECCDVCSTPNPSYPSSSSLLRTQLYSIIVLYIHYPLSMRFALLTCEPRAIFLIFLSPVNQSRYAICTYIHRRNMKYKYTSIDASRRVLRFFEILLIIHKRTRNEHLNIILLCNTIYVPYTQQKTTYII